FIDFSEIIPHAIKLLFHIFFYGIFFYYSFSFYLKFGPLSNADIDVDTYIIQESARQSDDVVKKKRTNKYYVFGLIAIILIIASSKLGEWIGGKLSFPTAPINWGDTMVYAIVA